MAEPTEPVGALRPVTSRDEAPAASPSRPPGAASQRAIEGATPNRQEAPTAAVDHPGSALGSDEGDDLPWLSALTEGLDSGPKKPSYDKVWKDHRDAGSEAPTVKTRADLEARLQGDSRQTKGLLELLDRDGLSSPKNLTAIDQIRQRLGPEKAEKALAPLHDFYLKQGNSQANQSLLQDVMHDLAIPSDIDQKDKGTCTMTAVQMKWAIEDPTSYARCLTELHAKGSCRMPDGSTLTRNDSHSKNPQDARSLTVKYLSDSLMGSCTSVWSGHLGGFDANDPNASGRTSSETLDALNRIFPGRGYTNETTFGSNRSTLIQYMEDELARGRTVTASVPGHHILVVGLDKSQGDPQVILNTWGEQKKMSLAEFEKYIRAVETVDDSGWDNRKTPAGRLTQSGDR